MWTSLTAFAAQQSTPAQGPQSTVQAPAVGAGLVRTEEQSFSEMNHRFAGAFMIVIALCAFAGNLSDRFRWANMVWPFFFILPGIYLIFFSDPEVWPMGAQSWLTMLATNIQATQHKTYAFLLIGLGWLEFRRARGKLGPFAQTWGFPLLAVFGATMLFFHPHEEAQAAAPAPMTHEHAAAPAESSAHDHMAMDHAPEKAKKDAKPAESPKAASGSASKTDSGHDHMAMEHEEKAAKPAPHEHDAKAAPAATPPAEHDSMAGMKMDGESGHSGHQDHSEHQRVKLQHLWFSIAGFGVAIFKLVYDGKFWRSPMAAALWPVCMAALGFLLIYYAE